MISSKNSILGNNGIGRYFLTNKFGCFDILLRALDALLCVYILEIGYIIIHTSNFILHFSEFFCKATLYLHNMPKLELDVPTSCLKI